MSETLDEGVRSSPRAPEQVAPAAGRPWGVWASLAWYVLVFEVWVRAYDAAEQYSGLQELLARSYLLHALDVTVAWGGQLVIIVLAVRMTRLPVRDYLGWIRPRVVDIALGIPAILALPVVFMLADLWSGVLTAADPSVQAYHAGVAAGVSPWWFVLGYWPAETLAPLVEESFFRGFLWRGLQFRFGNTVALLGTSLLFAAMHYNYYIQDGAVDPISIVQYLVAGLVLGWLRWRSGGSTVPMIVHAVSNVWVTAQVIALAALVS